MKNRIIKFELCVGSFSVVTFLILSMRGFHSLYDLRRNFFKLFQELATLGNGIEIYLRGVIQLIIGSVESVFAAVVKKEGRILRYEELVKYLVTVRHSFGGSLSHTLSMRR